MGPRHGDSPDVPRSAHGSRFHAGVEVLFFLRPAFPIGHMAVSVDQPGHDVAVAGVDPGNGGIRSSR